ncbi:hypothetical protein [Nonomuraea roseoviolacea]|uniref:WD40 repeat domain-containing protein n=1 Tax=Nonomuraea roseoviolacea subsp. carminata TaxID=160689 RepID=A0ABT1KA20_9ACTN|nr:hypothetical protein [Nonomuraea roseoviolacea]MCP2350454.1 hypothetical protein [Nonomuraea roseoviolacea subsp. carminata]
MRRISASAALLAAAIIGGTALAPLPAQAAHGSGATHVSHASRTVTGSPAARAAWIPSCAGKNGDTRACGHWRLLMADGRTVTVRDAAVHRTDAKGRPVGDEGRFAISGDGRVLAYERARDHRVVVRAAAGGPVTRLPRSLVPKGIGTGDLTLTLSPAGDRLLVSYDDDPARRPTKVVTIATGKVTELPAAEDPDGFSADGDEVLAHRLSGDNTTALVAHRLGGGSTRRTPPQVVANATTLALAADGRTVAVLIDGDADLKRPPRLRIYDLDSGELHDTVKLALKPSASPYLARWTADGRLVLTTTTDDPGRPAVVRVLTADPDTGEVRQNDRYTLGKDRYAFYVAGE